MVMVIIHIFLIPYSLHLFRTLITIDDRSSYVIYNMFFIQNKEVLEQFSMILLSYVILFLTKHSNSRVFWCNSRRNHAN